MDEPARRDILKLAAAGAALPLVTGISSAGAHVPVPDMPPAFADLARAFAAPPPDARPGIFWYWMNGNVTRAGITADLEAMAGNGIRTVMLFSIGGKGPDTLVDAPAQSLTPEWWDLVRFAVTEAQRLGLEMAMNACDGWATASGPWITPELAMQKVCWSEMEVHGGRPLAGPLPLPPTMLGHYRDLHVVAFRHPESWDEAPPSPRFSGTLATPEAAKLLDPANHEVVVDAEKGGDLVLHYDRPFTLRSVTVRTPPFPEPFAGVQRAANSLFVDAGKDDGGWRPIGRLDYPRHGWETGLVELTHALPPSRHHAIAPWTYEDPLEQDEPTDVVVETTRRGLTRLALVAAEVGSHFQREGTSHDPVAWMLAPRLLFGGAPAIEAALDRDHCLRAVLLHGLALGLDADPRAIDALVADGGGGGGGDGGGDWSGGWEGRPRGAEYSGTIRIRRLRLYSAIMVVARGGELVHLFHASVAPSSGVVRERIRSRFGSAAADQAEIQAGVDLEDEATVGLMPPAFRQMVERGRRIRWSSMPTFDLTVEHRIPC